MIWVLASLAAIVLTLELATLLMFQLNFKSFSVETDKDKMPFVSILVAARNEKVNLGKCLEALSQLNYPKAKIEILLGDDASTDSTAEIINRFSEQNEEFRSVKIKESYEGLVAKSKVLAQMINSAKGKYVAFIDADMAVTPDWLLQMTAPLSDGYAIVSGYSEVMAVKPFEKFQYYDWLNALHFLKSLSDTMKPATTLGNNMIVRLKDYREVGGFEAIGPNLVEDLALLKVMQLKNMRAIQIVVNNGRAQTLAVSSLTFWISQRKRWIKGALHGPLYEQLFLIVQRLMITIGILITLVQPETGLTVVVAKIYIEAVKSLQMHSKTTKKGIDIFLAISPVINSVMDTFALLGLLFKGSVKWKDRNY